MATAITARVMSSGKIRNRRLGAARGAGLGSGNRAAAGLSSSTTRLAFVSISDITNSARSDGEHDRREHNHINGKHEQSRVPDIAHQTETGGKPPQPDPHEPGS